MSEPTPMSERGRPVDAYVGARIRGRREHLRLSAAEFAGLVGLTPHLLATYEDGALQADAELLLVIAEALMVPIGYFFLGVRDAAAAVPRRAMPSPTGTAPPEALAAMSQKAGPKVAPPRPAEEASANLNPNDLFEMVRLWQRLSRLPGRRQLLETLRDLDDLARSLEQPSIG